MADRIVHSFRTFRFVGVVLITSIEWHRNIKSPTPICRHSCDRT